MKTINANIDELSKKLENLAENCIQNDEVIKVNTEVGNLVMIKEETYQNMMSKVEESKTACGEKTSQEDVKQDEEKKVHLTEKEINGIATSIFWADLANKGPFERNPSIPMTKDEVFYSVIEKANKNINKKTEN